jgi:hypothetical protein
MNKFTVLGMLILIFTGLFAEEALVSLPVGAMHAGASIIPFVRLSDEDIQALPVNNIAEILQTIPGITYSYGNLQFLGMHSGDLLFFLDGNEISFETAMKLNIRTFDEVSLISENDNYKYLDSVTGIVQIITKRGGRKLNADLLLDSDHIITDTNINSDNFNLSLGGPILPSEPYKLRFFADYSGSYNDTRFKDYYVADIDFLIENDLLDSSWEDNYESYNPYDGRDDFLGFDTDERNYNLNNLFLKCNYSISNLQRLTVSSLFNNEITHPYAHNWKYALEHYAETKENEALISANYNILFNSRTSLDVQASYYNIDYETGPRGVAIEDYFSMSDDFEFYALEDGLNPTVAEALTVDGTIGEAAENNLGWTYISATGEAAGLPFVYPGSIYGTNSDEEKETLTVSADLDYMYNEILYFTAGLEVKKYNLQRKNVSNP